jgi:hypothetical protein
LASGTIGEPQGISPRVLRNSGRAHAAPFANRCFEPLKAFLAFFIFVLESGRKFS